MTIHAYARSSQPPKSLRRNPEGAANAPLGVESQRAALLERWPDARVWVDAARSGRNGRRPALRAMLDTLEPGDVVAVVRLDRLARDLRLSLALELEIEHTRGCRIVSLAGEGTSLDGPPDPVATFNRRVAAAVAELQAAQAAATTAAAFKVKRQRGLATSGVPPFGQRIVDGRLEPDPAEHRVVDAVLSFTRGRLFSTTGPELARYLNDRGHVNRDGRPFNRTTALRLARRLAATRSMEAAS
jgi:DNA invertase Pin-like site-specific DNA recombinase